jgi:hypothetical protein
MEQGGVAGLLAALLLCAAATGVAQSLKPAGGGTEKPYLGFDRNDYPGGAALPALRKTFRYTSYWLINPPGESRNSWAGKRDLLRQYGFGFLVLFTGRTDAEIKSAGLSGRDAAALGAADGKAAAEAAMREGFPKNVLIFLDQEEGGRLLLEQADYLFAWIASVREAGARAAVYCSGIDVPEGSGTINTARDIVERENARQQQSSNGRGAERVALWVVNDACPPAPGCAFSALPLEQGVSEDLRRSTVVWQYALSPRRAQFSASCPQNQAADRNCYAPGLPASASTFVDLDTANSPDPSEDSF